MTEVMIKRVYEPEEKSDGYRVLVDKLWPRGMSKQELRYDLWEKDTAPSTPLREWYHEDPEARWKEFGKRYTAELEQSAAVGEFLDRIKNEKTVTLLYGAKNAAENHALVLQKFMERRLGS